METKRRKGLSEVLCELRSWWREDSGATLAIMTAAMGMSLSAVALAVDVGMMMSARSEAQRSADLAAMAGAGVLAQSPDNDEWATQEATEYASTSLVRKDPVQLLPTDVTVDLTQRTVRVVVNRTADRGTPVGTFFARIFGVSAIDVVADATAEASPAGGINCLLPLAIPDRWKEVGGPGNNPDDYNPEEG
ncbi:MAG: pilus assembly protein TadG-related protein, partial [Gemmatimonadota bacterium]